MGESWERFTCLLPPGVFVLLEDELERISDLAGIDPDDRLSQELKDGLAMEYLVQNSVDTMDEEVE